jgi:predicted nucleic acid-binding OB-fold protein
MKTVLSSLFIRKSLETIKLASLYCDQIVLPNALSIQAVPSNPADMSRELKIGQTIKVDVVAHSTVTDEIRDTLKPLSDEGILIYSDLVSEDELKDRPFTGIYEEIRDQLFHFLKSKGHLVIKPLYDEISDVILGNSPIVKIRYDIKDNSNHAKIYTIVESYFEFLANVSLAESIKHGCPLLSDSQVLSELMSSFMTSNRVTGSLNRAEQQSKVLSHQVLQTFLPNIKSASIEEVMEVRYKMKNELEGFRAAMSKLSATIKSHPWGPHIHEEADKIIETQVKPAIHDLTVSLSHSKLQVVQKIFENIKNPAAYIPFLATVNSNIKPAIAALASTGLVGAKVLWDILVERKKLEDTSGLVFFC